MTDATYMYYTTCTINGTPALLLVAHKPLLLEFELLKTKINEILFFDFVLSDTV